MKLSKETQAHIDKNNRDLYDKAHIDISVFFHWLAEQLPTGYWYALQVKYAGKRGKAEQTLRFSKNRSGELRGKQSTLADFLAKSATLFMPDTEGSVWLATFDSASENYDDISPHGLTLTQVRMWDVDEGNEVTGCDEVESSDPTEKMFLEKYVNPAWKYGEQERKDSLLSTFPDLGQADARSHSLLLRITQSLGNGRHQIQLDVVTLQGTLKKATLGIEKDGYNLSLTHNFEQFFDLLRQSILDKRMALVYLFSEKPSLKPNMKPGKKNKGNKGEPGKTVSAWKLTDDGLIPYTEEEQAAFKGMEDTEYLSPVEFLHVSEEEEVGA